MTEVSPWFDDWVNFGVATKVLNAPHGRFGMDVEAHAGLVLEAGSHLTRYYANHGFLTPSPGVTSDSFECVFEHGMSGDYGAQWWSYQGYFYPPDHGFPADTTPTCMDVEEEDLSMEVQSRQAGYGLMNTDGPGDYVQGNSNAFSLGFHLKPWLDLYGPDAGWGLPDAPPGATIEWEYDRPDFQGLDAVGDEDTTVEQFGLPGAPVAWRPPNNGLSGHYDQDTGNWFFHTGEKPQGPVLALNDGDTFPFWNDITSFVDFPYVTGEAPPVEERDYDLIVTATSGLVDPPSCEKPGSADYYRYGQWLALRVRMQARRYRFVYNTVPVTRQYPRDTLGMAPGNRVFPPPRTERVVGGHM